MVPGKILRKVLGRHLSSFARVYRRLYLDPEKLVRMIDQYAPLNAHNRRYRRG